MTTVAEIKERLRAPGTPFSLVRGGAQLASVKDRPELLPAAFVLVTRDASAENSRATGPVMQRSERDVTVVIVCEDLSDADGDAAADELETLKTYVRVRLIGFKPGDMVDVITHVGGEIIEARAGCAWFGDTFSAPTYLKETT